MTPTDFNEHEDRDSTEHPVGSGDYSVQPGDCVSSIAHEAGFFWETIWKHPANAELKQLRGNPNVLLPGDRLTIPAKEARHETRATEQRHRFVRKGVPAKFRMRLLMPEEPQQTPGSRPAGPAHGSRHVQDGDPEQSVTNREVPRRNEPFILAIDGVLTQGQTDEDGYLEVLIPPNAKEGSLTLDAGTLHETVMPLQLGHLDPLTEIRGVKQRLANLGLDCGDAGTQVSENFRAAVRAFQQMHGLQQTGETDPATRDKLKTVHGS